jgi:hypothetical protein
VISGANIEVRNQATNVVSRAATTDRGVYSVPALDPGTYTVTAAAAGFKNLVRSNLELRVGDRLNLDLQLEIGAPSESIQVVGETPLLETASASSGTVIDRASVAALPLLGRNPFSLMAFTGGEVHTPVGAASGIERPFDNGGMDSYSVNGGQRFTNEFLLDGSPNTTTEGTAPTNLGFVPPPDAVGEFKMQSNLYDAEFGRSGGAVVNVSLKSGTNDYHGAAYWYLRNDKLNANSVQANAAGIPLTAFRWAQPGAMLSGPVVLPKLYNGKDKTFFMYSFELVRSSVPRPSSLTVPTALERQGDFSQTLFNGNPITIYDPLTTVQVSPGVYQRTPFAGSKIPISRINPVAATLMGYYPMPNGFAPRGLPNLTVSPNPTTDAYNAHTFRLDQVLNANHRFSFTFDRGNRHESGGLGGGRDAFVAIGHPEAANTYNHWRVNHGAVFNFTSLLSPTWLSTTRASFERHQFAIIALGYGYDASKIGWPTSLTTQFEAPGFPSIAPAGYTTLGLNGGVLNFSNTYAAGETLSKVLKDHTVKFGAEMRALRTDVTNPAEAGAFNTNQSFTQTNPLVPDPASGDSIASLLLGYLSSGTNSFNNRPAWGNHYYDLFLQDDWRVTRKLTLNLGLRWDYESPQTDRYNRDVIGFDTSTPSRINGNGPTVYGGLLFATSDRRFAYHRDLHEFQPRIGLAYQISKKMVFRGGWGISYLPTLDYPPSLGFSASTPVVASADGGITPLLTAGAGALTNPFPSGINYPTGSSLGLQTFLGQGLTYYYPNRNVPFVHSFSAGLQYQLPFRSVFEAQYVGSRTKGLEVNKNIDSITAAQFTSIGAGLLATQPNPYVGLLPGTSLNTSTITLQQALLPYPQFTSVTENGRNVGSAWYDSMQLKLEKRMSAGLYLLFNFTWSKNMTRNTYLNGQYDQVGQLARIISSDDIPHAVNLGFTYQVPFAKTGKGIERALLGGWVVGGNFSWSSGPLLEFSVPGAPANGPVNPLLGPITAYAMGDPTVSNRASNPTEGRWFNNCVTGLNGQPVNAANCAGVQPAWRIIPAYALTNTSPRFNALRRYRPMQNNLSMFKNFKIWERVMMEFRAEAFNAFNTPEFTAPNLTPTNSLFGITSNTQANDPRAIQMALRLTF